MDERPKIGVGVIVRKDGKVLMGLRKNSHGESTWCCPGGHLEFVESIEDCARREVLEETGIKIKNIKFGPYTNDIFVKEKKHYVTLCVVSDYDSDVLKTMEPDKCERWEWFSWDNLPSPLFLPEKNWLKLGFNPFK
ncbi:MAG: NUDIX hydrolase [Candidatus Woesearchaeota archaeon]